MTNLYPGFNADELVAARIAARDNDVEDRAVLMERSKVRFLRSPYFLGAVYI